MALNIQDKKAIVAEVAKVAKVAVGAATAEYQGITVSQITKLRANARKVDVYLRVVRNTLARRAVENTPFACLNDTLSGPLILAFSKNEPGAAAKLFRDFLKENEKFQVKALVVGGTLYDVKQLDVVAKLPTREEAIATLMAVMKAPITKFVRTLVEPHAKFVRTVAAVRDKKAQAA